MFHSVPSVPLFLLEGRKSLYSKTNQSTALNERERNKNEGAFGFLFLTNMSLFIPCMSKTGGA